MNKKSIITNKVMSIESKKRFIKCFVWSVLLYECVAWTISKITEKILMAMEMWCWKRMLRISWTKKITNEKVLELVGNKRSLMETIRKRQLSTVGHIIIIRENGLERLRKARGRQRSTYLVILAETVGLTCHQLIRCAGYRKEFRSLAGKASI